MGHGIQVPLKTRRLHCHARENQAIDWNRVRPTPPAHLYHYTSSDGLAGLLESRRAWATHAGFLNDSSEVVYAYGLIEGVFQSLMTAYNWERTRRFLTDARAQAGPFVPGYQSFVFSLTELDDDLGFWRAYADRGRGVAIGFASARLQKCLLELPDRHHPRVLLIWSK